MVRQGQGGAMGVSLPPHPWQQWPICARFLPFGSYLLEGVELQPPVTYAYGLTRFYEIYTDERRARRGGGSGETTAIFLFQEIE